jgi:AcrR family transcriptional regulator
VAAACGVSEKTVFNYFPTKESLLLDREDEMADDIREALGPAAGRVSPVDAAVAVLVRYTDDFTTALCTPGGSGMEGLRRFTDLIERTPALRAAQTDMTERLTQIAAEAMAARAGVNPDDPEPQIAAGALLGLWRIYWRGLGRYSESSLSAAAVRERVVAEIRRAARLIDTGLWSFGLAVQGVDGRQQQRNAAAATNEARQQVMLAIRQAREAWRLTKAERDPPRQRMERRSG